MLLYKKSNILKPLKKQHFVIISIMKQTFYQYSHSKKAHIETAEKAYTPSEP